MKKKIFITQPSLPNLNEFVEIFSKAWEKRTLTNHGELHLEFELNLSKYLGVKYLSLCSNATNGLIIAQRALNFKGEIITSPFSFIATAHSIKWNGLKPVFVDVETKFGNLCLGKVESAINRNTGGILATHNYGFPGKNKELTSISKRYGIPLLYDCAPGFGVKIENDSITSIGDISVLSFHATKVFTTFEGGAIISSTLELKKKVDLLLNFGIVNEETVSSLGTNSKLNESQAAMGLLQLKYIDDNIKKRKAIYNYYLNKLEKNKDFKLIDIPKKIDYNFSYFPLFFKEGFEKREQIFKKLLKNNIFCRKYWYPLISDHSVYKNDKKYDLTNARELSNCVLCLPIYPNLSKSDQKRIVSLIS